MAAEVYKMKINAIGLFVKDMKTMVNFYRDVMGMQCNWNGEPNAELEAGGVRLIMFGREDFEKMTSQKFGYPEGLNGTMELSFDFPHFTDVDKEFRRLIKAGATSILKPTDEPWGQRTSYVSDPEGNLIEIASFGKET
jgi:lactoylglutathione lyase